MAAKKRKIAPREKPGPPPASGPQRAEVVADVYHADRGHVRISGTKSFAHDALAAHNTLLDG